MKDVSVTLTDRRVLNGYLSRIGANNNKWVLWKLNEQGQQDTVQFEANAIEEIRLLSIDQSESLVPEAESLVLESSSRLHVEAGVLTLGTEASWPVSNLDEIAITETGRDQGRGLLVGLGIGVLAGFATGAVIGERDQQSCGASSCIGPTGPVLVGSVFGAVGGLVGLLVGGAISTKSVTVYKYRPDSPRQMSVLIGVRPSMTKSRGAR